MDGSPVQTVSVDAKRAPTHARHMLDSAPPSNVILALQNVRVTPHVVQVGGTTYQIANITSLSTVVDDSLRNAGIATVVGGFLLIVIWQAWIFALAALTAGSFMIHFGRVFELVLTTGAGEQQALRSREKRIITRTAAAINVAIAQRDTRR